MICNWVYLVAAPTKKKFDVSLTFALGAKEENIRTLRIRRERHEIRERFRINHARVIDYDFAFRSVFFPPCNSFHFFLALSLLFISLLRSVSQRLARVKFYKASFKLHLRMKNVFIIKAPLFIFITLKIPLPL